MKIKIITDRRPWAGEKPHDLDAEVDVPDEDAQLLIEREFAVAVVEPAPAAPAKGGK